jgi:hypothetical protein
MLWQGAKWRILKNFNVQNEECHNYEFPCMMEVELKDWWHIPLGEVHSSTKGEKRLWYTYKYLHLEKWLPYDGSTSTTSITMHISKLNN